MSFTPPTVTGYSAFYDPAMARPGNGSAANYNAVPRVARTSHERRASIALGAGGFRGMRRAMRVLNAQGVGFDATETYTRASAQAGPVEATGLQTSGLRTMEVVTVNSGNTTAAQRDYITNRIIDAVFAVNPTFPYVEDASGNGGGGKMGF